MRAALTSELRSGRFTVGRIALVCVVGLACSIADRVGAAEGAQTNAPTTPGQELPLSILRTAEQVHGLSRKEAASGREAIIRGVVTCVLPGFDAAVIQDSTRGIYVRGIDSSLGLPPRMGEEIEIEGVTDPGEFAPQIQARRMTRLGTGTLPPAKRPTWDQLINGSLDTQYVEIPGVVTAVREGGVTLLTHGGKVHVLLHGANGATNGVRWAQLDGALIRLRACLFASWDADTRQVRVGEIRMFWPEMTVDEPAPQDLFALTPKRAAELLEFDPQASALRRVRVCGQVVHERDGEYFMMEGTDGLRFFPKEPVHFQVGDRVDVVGFPSLTGPSPVLREAVARRTGVAALPEAVRLTEASLFGAQHDATRVSVEAVLLSLSADRQTLEVQAGLRRFLARQTRPGSPVSGVPVGSRVEMTGIYAGRGGNRTTGAALESFEVLLNSPEDVRVLARPSWWTLRRLAMLVGALVGVLAGALAWVRLLHHKVRERTAQLQKEIREREQAEHQRTLAQERGRIARDLHDDLGSSLTEITLLATSNPDSRHPGEESSERLEAIARKSRTLVHALDELVWAVDPARDSLASTARYLVSYAEEYLGGLNIACRVQMPNSFPEEVVSGEARHQLFLAVKEALNNAVRHGAATEVGLQVRVLENRLQISIRDNGSGFDPSDRTNGHGLLNLRHRLENLNGSCRLDSAPGAGTTVLLQLNLPLQNHTT